MENPDGDWLLASLNAMLMIFFQVSKRKPSSGGVTVEHSIGWMRF
jgi:hypothetical protein